MATKVISKESVVLIAMIVLFGLHTQGAARDFAGIASLQQATLDTIPKEWYGANPEEFDRPYKSSKGRQAGSNPEEYNSDLTERSVFQEEEEEAEIPIFYEADVTRAGLREIPAVPENYSGFRVQILLAETPLPPDHIIFTRHGSIAAEQLSEGVYAYLVGDFPTEEAAVEFTDVYLAKLYPGLRIVQFELGKRKF